MPRFKYVGDMPISGEPFEMYGAVWQTGIESEVADEFADKLRTNQFFVEIGAPHEQEPLKRRPGRPRKGVGDGQN